MDKPAQAFRLGPVQRESPNVKPAPAHRRGDHLRRRSRSVAGTGLRITGWLRAHRDADRVQGVQQYFGRAVVSL